MDIRRGLDLNDLFEVVLRARVDSVVDNDHMGSPNKVGARLKGGRDNLRVLWKMLLA